MKLIAKSLPLAFWCYVLVLTVLNLKPGNPNAPEMGEILFIRRDYFHHIVAYLILAAMYGTAMISSRPVFRKNPVLYGILLMVALAVTLEALQVFVPHRRFNWYDMAANVTGLILGALLVFIVSRFAFCVPRS
jgi:VanZ family protein